MSGPVTPPDPERRRFFRQFAHDAVTSVGSVIGAAQSLQQTSADAARELLGGDVPAASTMGAAAATGAGLGTAEPEGGAGPGIDASTAGWRAPFRWDGDACRVVDQRYLPQRLVDREIRSAADAVSAIRDGAVVGSAVQAQVAAVTLALVAARAAASRAFARRATIKGAANALRTTRPGSAPMTAVLDRMLALLDAQGLEADGETVAAAMRAEAERIVSEATDDHGALVGHVLTLLPGAPDDPVRVMVAGSTGAMGGGQFGTALSAVQAAHHAGRPVRALVPEGRPGLEGARIAAWELRQAGVEYAVVTDAAAPGCIAAGEVDLVLAGADRVAANGDVVAPAGAYPLALACAAAGVPFVACATTGAVDPSVATGSDARREDGRPGGVLRVGDTVVAPEGTRVRNPLQDLVPATLVAALATEVGVLRAPYGLAIAAAVEAGAARRASAPGFAALATRRAADGAALWPPWRSAAGPPSSRGAPRTACSCASSWRGTGCSPRTRSATSRSASSLGRDGGSRRRATGSWPSRSSTRVSRPSRCS